MNRERFFGFAFLLILVAFSPVSHAVIYPLEIFTNNGLFNDSPDIDMFVVVSEGLPGQVDFTIHNNNSISSSSISAIYFDDGVLLDVVGITEGAGTNFSRPATPGNLPAGNELAPSFVTTDEFSIHAGPPPPYEGINFGEHVTISFDLAPGGTFANVIEQMNAGDIRIGIHLIALPDGSSESAVTVPEPATICLLGLSTLGVLRKRKLKLRLNPLILL